MMHSVRSSAILMVGSSPVDTESMLEIAPFPSCLKQLDDEACESSAVCCFTEPLSRHGQYFKYRTGGM